MSDAARPRPAQGARVEKAGYKTQFATLGPYIYERYSRHRGQLHDAPKQDLSSYLTLPLQTPPTPQSRRDAGDIPPTRQDAGPKRKRGANVDDKSRACGPVTSPTRQGDEAQLGGMRTCSNCAQAMELPSPDMVTCRDCCKSWHQQCLAPRDLASAADGQEFSCLYCRSDSQDYTDDEHRGHMVRKLRKQRLATLPDGVYPAKPKLVGFYARKASDSERTEYFSTKRRTDLINILSFCDQLEPHLLVDMLVSASKRHPDLPIFDCPDWRSKLPSAAPSSIVASPRPLGRPRHGHRLNVAKVPRKPKGRRRVQNRTVMVKASDGEAGQDGQPKVVEVVEVGEEEVQDSLPPTWPKAGEGLYSGLLSPDNDPGAFMVDQDDEEAFSHFMVEEVGKQMVITACG
ncbi:hypothetical protein CDD82_1695 [Ophiocordyceps australis]|uniref:PHD-type domain-containing protein n=1 Tax=Ophiocordyceps australis TaxID=1399860 RepID=A0A2C5ZHM5_9HYPO|nr:hypothetical protein CDD82_1695 [Ophiocordyceps australis]